MANALNIRGLNRMQSPIFFRPCSSVEYFVMNGPNPLISGDSATDSDSPNSLDNKGSWRILKDFYCSVTMLRELGLIQNCYTSCSFWSHNISWRRYQSILIETSSCNVQFFSELITTQLRISHGVTANSLYLSSSPCKATSFTYFSFILKLCLLLTAPGIRRAKSRSSEKSPFITHQQRACQTFNITISTTRRSPRGALDSTDGHRNARQAQTKP